MSKFMEIKYITTKGTHEPLAKELQYSDSTLKRYRIDIKLKKKPSEIENGLKNLKIRQKTSSELATNSVNPSILRY